MAYVYNFLFASDVLRKVSYFLYFPVYLLLLFCPFH